LLDSFSIYFPFYRKKMKTDNFCTQPIKNSRMLWRFAEVGMDGTGLGLVWYCTSSVQYFGSAASELAASLLTL
jgi:hypothetical protein